MEFPDLGDHAAIGTPMLDEIRRTAERRLREIEPLIDEAERLREVLAVIERRVVTERARPRSVRARGDGAEPASRAAKGANKRLILELVGQRPGITPAEIASSTGLKRTVVASTVSRLKRHGELRDHEQGGVCLPGLIATGTPSPHRRVATSATSPKRARRLAPVA